MNAIYILGSLIVGMIVILIINRIWRLHHDQILNPQGDPFLTFAEQERRQYKLLFSPWTTTDSNLLTIVAKYFPDVVIPLADKLKKPDITPVKIVALQDAEIKIDDSEPNYFIAVGGPSAAMVAFEHAKNGAPVLYINRMDPDVRPIWAGAANHIEPDVLTEAPAFISDRAPLQFLWREWKRLLNPPRYDDGVLRDQFPWLTLNIIEWLLHPEQWLTGWRVARGNQLLARQYQTETLNKRGVPKQFYELQNRTHCSGAYLESFHQNVAKILREPYGSLIVAPEKKNVGSTCYR